MNTGIYLITNTLNGKVYVGSAAKFNKRWTDHKSDLRKKRHHNPHLQHSWDKYGEAAFCFSILEHTTFADLLIREQYYIDFYNATDPSVGYNVCPVAGSGAGRTMSEESKEKMRKFRLGTKQSEETKAKIREASIGSNNHFYGKKHTNATKGLISAANKGTSLSLETKQKMSEAHKGRVFTEEHKAKISEANRRRTISEETRRRMSESAKNRVNRP